MSEAQLRNNGIRGGSSECQDPHLQSRCAGPKRLLSPTPRAGNGLMCHPTAKVRRAGPEKEEAHKNGMHTLRQTGTTATHVLRW